MGSSGFNWKLADHPKLPKGKTVGLIVLDGWGEANPDQYNCIHVAETPVMDSFKKAGGEMLAELVGITLGPKGRNVVLQNKYGPPKIVNDGETVLKQIELEDPVENVGVKLVRQAGAKTNDLAGDGSTTAVILAHGLITEVVKDNLMCTKMFHLGTPLKT